MSTFNEAITLTNVGDVSAAERNLIPQSAIRAITVDACVDTGSWFLVINEEVRAALGLKTVGLKEATLANGAKVEYPLTEPVNFRWKDREMAMNALLLPDAEVVLFGALCVKALDLIADPVDECLKGRHGAEAVYQLY
ncbi:MAG: hypothetical protein LBC72_03060 [Spirochaetaceae bacterium]|jgi:predicted aspartyl protease|nr:hypothetical protein [Spirochaetaceae bacterium]